MVQGIWPEKGVLPKMVRAVGLEPTLREETEFESVASTIPPRPLGAVDI